MQHPPPFPDLEHLYPQIACEAHASLLSALAILDRLGEFQAGAHLSMAIVSLERSLGDLLPTGSKVG